MYPSYFEEFVDKHGFGDGDHQPGDAEDKRRVFVRLFNARAKADGTTVRACVFDRPGLHNCCMVVFLRTDSIAALGITDPDNADQTVERIWRNPDINPDTFVDAHNADVTRVRMWLDRHVDESTIIRVDVDEDELERQVRKASQ